MIFNLNEEIIDGHLVTAETKKLWAVEIDLANKLFEVCDKYNLKVWAAAGTLLGAVRHKGFIPWDDDMDFEMMRDDFNKLMEIGPTEFKEPYFFQSIYTDDIGGGVIHIRNSNTTMLENGYEHYKKKNFGCAIDVFVLDVVPNDKKTFNKVYRKVGLMRRMVNNYKIFKSDFYKGKTRLFNLFTGLFFTIVDIYRFDEKIVRLLSRPQTKTNKYITAIEYSIGMGRSIEKVKLYPKEWYNEIIYLPFFEYSIPAPIQYHKVLTCLFGDYMTPIKGGANHTFFLVDCNRSYKEVLEELMNQQAK